MILTHLAFFFFNGAGGSAQTGYLTGTGASATPSLSGSGGTSTLRITATGISALPSLTGSGFSHNGN
jgi:hypothetical protein